MSREINDLKAYDKNPRKMTSNDFKLLQNSLKEFGDLSGVVFNKTTGNLVGGHQRTQHFKHTDAKVVITEDFGIATKAGTIAVGYIELNGERFNYREVEWDENAEARANILANKVSADWDFDMLNNAFDSDMLMESGFDEVELAGFMTEFGGDAGATEEDVAHGSLMERFGFPPFSVLNARSGEWQDRKRAWIALGIKSEEGRDEDLAYGAAQGRVDITSKRIMASGGGTSVFDPVLCELMYEWFSPEEGTILDPFAGGSVRGIVASKLRRQYTGIELSEDQVKANIKQGKEITTSHKPTWICGDSNKAIPTDKEYDMVFSCPPYADLEVYSDDEADISNMDYDEFNKVYGSIIKKSVAQLKDDRFAVFVVGEVRDKKTGMYKNFVADTIQAFKDAGMEYYNEIILVTSVGSLPLRSAKTFNAGRKVGKTHQNVLVFYKGDTKNIKKDFGAIDLTDVERDLGDIEEIEKEEV